MNTNLALNHVSVQTCPKGSGAAKQPDSFGLFHFVGFFFFHFLFHKVNSHVRRRADFLLRLLVDDIQEQSGRFGGLTWLPFTSTGQ